MCLIKESDKLKINDDEVYKLPFSKYPMKKWSEKSEPWHCCSVYMKGNNVPEEYCQCLLGINPGLSYKTFIEKRFNSVSYVKAKDSELRFC